MKRALLIGVAEVDPTEQFEPGPSLRAMQSLLDELGGWAITRVAGVAASRGAVLAALAKWESEIEPDDVALLYFVGHGGVVEIRDLPPPLGGRPVFYVATARPDANWRFEGVLDVELSLVVARVDGVCANVTVIVDSCYSARTVRGPAWVLERPPAWLRELDTQLDRSDCDALLHPTSHPRVVRLAGSSSLRMSFADPTDEGHLARLTGLFVDVVRKAGDDLGRLTWDAVAHCVREQAIWRSGCEEQWVSLAGPRQRLVFSRDEAPLPRTVGFVPQGPGIGWIRAGALQGVELGDEWGLAALTLDEQLQPRWIARMRVTEVDLSRAALTQVDGDDLDAALGASAWLLEAETRMRVGVDGPDVLCEAVARSAWLSPVVGHGDELSATLCRADHDRLELQSEDDRFAPASFRADERGRAQAIELAEDWARSRRLLAVAGKRADPGAPIRLSLSPARGAATRLQALPTSEAARLHVGDRLNLIVRSHARASWFVTLVGIDVAGRPTLLDAAEPDGREILAGERYELGELRSARNRGFEPSWPVGVDGDRPRRAALILLASRRPIALGHLINDSLERRSNGKARRRPAATRRLLSEPRPRTGPELAPDWCAQVFHYWLDPDPRRPR